MSLLAAWIVYPLVLALLCAGMGLAVDLLTGRRLPGALVLPAGLAAIVVVGGFTTASDATAELTVPLLVGIGTLGIGLSYPWRFRRVDPWAAAAAIAVFLIFGAPVYLSGEPTFAGYIKLDDTATWLAMTDRVMEYGRSLAGLEVSTYRSTLDFNLAGGYPVGVFIPFGTGQRLVGGDLAWVFQPYVSFLAAMLSLCLWQVLGALSIRRASRALAAFLVAQPALLYGYALWGGVKEVAAAALLALVVALSPLAVRREGEPRDVIPLALAAAALVGVLSPGGLIWVTPLLAVLAVLAYRRLGRGRATARAGVFLMTLVLLIVPALASGLIPPTSKSLVGSDGEGNLRGPLNALQALGIWPTGDFRLDPGPTVASAVLIGLGVFAAALGTWWAWRRRSLPPLLLVAALPAAAAIVVAGSPWAAGKALATVSPVVLALAVVGAVAALRIDRIAGALLVAAVGVGVLWSNALAYHDVDLAPYAQLRELESIGEEFAGEGPALITEYQPNGARHFLRRLDAEGASELRFRQVTLTDGTLLEKGDWADTDRVSSPALVPYRTLVLRRGPAQSRPPSTYSLARRGRYYHVWQRRPGVGLTLLEHLPLGGFAEPDAVPSCAEVRRLAALAGPGGSVAAVPRLPNVNVSLRDAEHPPDWTPIPGRPELIPRGPGTMRVRVDLRRAGRYDLYVQGGARNRLSLSVDGVETGSATMQLNQDRQFLLLGRARLRAGPHLIRLEYAGQSLAPGSGGEPLSIGPLVLSPASAANPPVRQLPSSRATELCGQHLDWVEALSSSAP